MEGRNRDKERGRIVKEDNLKGKNPLVLKGKLSSVIGGIVRSLKDKGLPLEITIKVKAETGGKFDRNTLDIKAKETLQQIGVVIVEWKEEQT